MSIYGHLLESAVYEKFDNIEISAEKINELCNYCNTINESSTDIVLTEAGINIGGFFKKLGIKDGKISQEIKKVSENISNIIKKDGITKESKKSIASTINDFYDKLGDYIVNNSVSLPKAKIKGYDTKKINYAISLASCVVVISSIIGQVLTGLFGPIVGQQASAIVVAPIIEEIAKQVSIKKDFATEYAVVFNLLEASMYIYNNKNPLMPTKILVRIRSFVAGMHITTTIIQWLTSNEAVQKKLGLDKKEDRDKLSLLGHIIGILIHAIWNYNAIFSLQFNLKLAGLA